MRKKILIIGICLVGILVLVVVGGFFVVKKVGYGGIIFISTGVPTYISNKVLPPPNLKKKSDEDKRKIVIKLLRESQQAAYSYQLLKSIELEVKILRLGSPVVPVLIDLFRDKSIDGTEEDIIIYQGTVVRGVIREGAIGTLREIIMAKMIPLEKRLKERLQEKDLLPPFMVKIMLKKFYNYANKIEIDMDKVVSELIGILENALPIKDDLAISNIASFFKEVKDKRSIPILIKAFEQVTEDVTEYTRAGILDNLRHPQYKRACKIRYALMRIEEALIELLKKFKDRRIAEALDSDGANYKVWIWVDSVGRDKAIRIAMDMLRGEKKGKGYAIEVLGTAKAKEAVLMLLGLLEREKDTFVRESIITSLGKIKDKRAVEPLINLARKRFSPPQRDMMVK